MRPDAKNYFFPRLIAALLAAALPLQSAHADIALATTPMQNSAATTVKPNLMFMLDDSGSMAWDYLPDVAGNFANLYGFNTSQCNGVYYNPNVAYSAPVKSDGTPLNATATTFTAAYQDGYNTGAGTVNLNTAFTGGSMAGNSGISLTPGSAFYYDYSGTQNTTALQNYFNTSSTFYQECNSAVGSTPGSNVFTLHRLASTSTTTLTVQLTGGTITVNTGGSRTAASSVKVTVAAGTKEILSGTTGRSSNSNTLASSIAANINNCTGGTSGTNCTVSGFSATVSGNVVTIVAPVGNPATATTSPAVTNSSGTGTYTYTAFGDLSATTTVSSIKVGSTQLLSSSASASGSRPALASAIQSNISAAGYSATVSNNVVTVTAPTSAAGLTPVVTLTGPLQVIVGGPFPDSDATKLQNFANWFSYYSDRINMMKTGAGLAFQRVTDQFRVGFMTMNNNVSPDIVSIDTFPFSCRTLSSFFR